MCLTCGCMEPDNRHDDDRQIIMQDLVDAARANDAGLKKTLRTMRDTLKAVRDGDVTSAVWQPKQARE